MAEVLVSFIPFPTGLIAVHFHDGLEAAALATARR